MSERRITFETLSAYVDGELDTASAAQVARAVAEDPVLAREVAALSRLRSAVAESIDVPPLSLPARPSQSGRRTAIAAGVALMVFVVGSILVSNFGHGPGTDWLARAWQVHRGWSLESVVAEATPAAHFAQITESVPGAYVPDLSSSRLSLVHAVVVPFAGEDSVLLAGYRGTRGCKISLLIFPSPGALGEILSPFHDGDQEAYGWAAGPLAYVILSDGMNPGRFRLLAESVREASRRHLPFSNEMRFALRKSRDESPPCVA